MMPTLTRGLLQEGDPVLVQNYLQGEKWLPGTIEKKTGPVSCTVKLDDGRSRRCHQDQVRKRFKEIAPPEEEPDVDIPKQSPEVIVDPKTDELPEVEALPGSHEPKVTPAVDAKKIYPRRERKPVDRFEPKWFVVHFNSLLPWILLEGRSVVYVCVCVCRIHRNCFYTHEPVLLYDYWCALFCVYD